MKAKLICYNLSKLKQSKKDKAKNYLWGYIDHSNYSRYTYKRKGLLDEIPYLKLAKAVIIVLEKDENNVTKIFKELKAKYSVFSVDIDKSDLISRKNV